MSWDIEVLTGVPTGALRDEVEALAARACEPAWYTALNADRNRPAWFLGRRDGRLAGFLTVFDPSGQAAEVEAFVAPGFRRGGLFGRLLTEARRFWEAPGRRWLLVAGRSDRDGWAVADHLGKLSFTESVLVLPPGGRPPFPGLPDGLTLEPCGPEDIGAAAEVHGRANGEGPGAYRAFLSEVVADPQRRVFVLRSGGRTVGVGGFHREAGAVMLFGLSVDPEFQGRGWGRALVLALLDLGAPGTGEFTLEVDSSNARAEKLYRSIGFTDRSVTDYFQLPG